jgi:2-haloacid dehalogenase
MPQIIHVFDAYGTLFDTGSATLRHAAEIGPKAPELATLWRTKTLEASWIHALAGKPTTFRKLLKSGLNYALSATGITTPGLSEKLIAGYDDLAPYPDVKDALTALRKKRSRIAILSNGDPDMLDKAVRSAGLDGLIDHILSAHEVGIFKPSSRVYRLAMTKFGATREEITYVSANRWDVAGASAFGFSTTAWLNRSHAPDEYLDMPPSLTIPDLHSLPLLQPWV